MNRFYTPFVGQNYQQGINGKKVLVLGASFYCNKTECQFYNNCTDTAKKDSSAYNAKCPSYQNDNLLLTDEPSHCVGDGTPTHTRFAKYMGELIGSDDYYKTWSHLAFTNYVQFFLPANTEGFRETYPSDLSERDFKAFIETLQELQPDVVVIWGSIINSRLKENNEYLISKDELKATEYYVCHIKVPGISHKIALINPYHPSSSAWYGDMEKFDTYFKSIL